MPLSLTRFSLSLVCVAALAACQSAPPSSSTPSSMNTTAVTEQVVRQALAPALYEIVYSAKQDAVFVASAGGREANAPKPRILRLDPLTLAVQAEIVLERPGLGLALDDDSNRLYVGNAFQTSVTVLDTRTNAVVGVAQLAEKIQAKGPGGKDVERYPHNLRELVLDPSNHRLYAPGLWFSGGVLYVMNTQTLQLEKVIPGFGFGAAGITLDAQKGKVYVGNMQGQLMTVDTRSLTLENTHEVAADQLLNLRFEPATGKVLATDHGSDRPNMVRETMAKLDYTIRGDGNRVVVIDPASGAVDQSIATGLRPVALLADEARHRLYVTNRESASVTVYDSRSYALLKTFELPAHPNSLALDPRSGAVFVTIKNAEDAPATDAESVARLLW
ncbi:YncE family protein [Lampropedia puyangensis]|uniref:YncE family protein n=1 Tax=Lampropedia puyangensis TaxID=1330072 RepID=A0A4S8F3H6_9BURK|nr:YncE family protein [Lampropedia puyangensis]THU01933.1 YncE family protein [Lampropedia puyangensis]